MATAGLESGASLLYLHVPGTRMIEEGVDGASRAGAQRITGPACSGSTRAAIEEMVRRHGWKVTIDLFAANCNKSSQRFASWTDEPDSEEDRVRGRRQLLGPIESEERARVREELLRLADSAIVASQSEVAQNST